MEQLAAYANRAVDDSAYLWLHLFPNGDEDLHVSARETDDTLYHGIQTYDRDSLLRTVGMTGEEYGTIIQCLKDIGCIGISVTPDRRQTQIHYMYGGPFDEFPFGYFLYSAPMTDEELTGHLRNDHHVPCNDSVVFLMGWPNQLAREKYLRKHNFN